MLRLVFAVLALLAVSTSAVLSAEDAALVNSGKRLIQFGPGVKVWVSEEQLDELDRSRHETFKLGVGYFDITDFQEPVTPVPRFNSKRMAFPTGAQFQSVVTPLLAAVSPSIVSSTIQALSAFTNRYYTTTTGVQSAQYLRDLMQGYADKAGRSDANCSLFTHSWQQPSVVCRIEGQGTLADEVIVTGAHLDSINSRAVPNGVAPGADDDASGVASFVETFRILLESGFRPLRSIEFVGYGET